MSDVTNCSFVDVMDYSLNDSCSAICEDQNCVLDRCSGFRLCNPAPCKECLELGYSEPCDALRNPVFGEPNLFLFFYRDNCISRDIFRELWICQVFYIKSHTFYIQLIALVMSMTSLRNVLQVNVIIKTSLGNLSATSAIISSCWRLLQIVRLKMAFARTILKN